FQAAAVRAAHAGDGDATDDVTLVERRGGTVVLVDGDRRNLKLT
ncbi:MAG: bifunctional 2-C-methyl-D-erythritol 4-phosphate cytidylyltransferase/2-C-methyl-D-erythritol 2,4-cyclodiphosphate synthase, partial [Actinobacteria bacterium]|nr:bifunctional 2-C-methyl-D-erythritol 4-phosphate cytidylyltransferase/2-C-methyl-D-erythritol 2,4-cyclodiphosphate synthase [Actinomycetota bacterium]NIS30865.1 bifunctional 2-C-methyl-D-erythritol 4-phosphate cytidylyltransferase/2-C-methyl-D-erythritol 2,4-cyclodiphosphate synthase [Actinomycetota bacterium]NIT95336.1 bifunctional 2-C-methyl-D-erythritol 4-phosphate cytidylyltransferase/2-C-methyl-D-erythritol 2,4-cyclodiphosphate synthase [Actinomycetota bacterium]NIU19011.1 bifunctional 2